MADQEPRYADDAARSAAVSKSLTTYRETSSQDPITQQLLFRKPLRKNHDTRKIY